MEFNAVYHQASDNYCYPLNEDELIINIKTCLLYTSDAADE